uniref:Folded gastrulation N-terminal domain-containing protein n=1 Tax=Cacopsylla melanoneura TaxID=428564 RepID=A0A8D8X3B3_9HEMI
MSPASAKFKKSISLLFIFNLGVWIVVGSKLENPDWTMWIDTEDGQLSNKRITAKSVFIAPPITKCPEGHRVDHAGHCVKIATINHANQWQFFMDKLNFKFGKKPEANAVVANSDPFKLNIPIFNPVQESTTKKNNATNKPESANNSQKPEMTTRKQPHFTNLFDMQTTFTTNGKTTDFPSTNTNSQQTESTTKTEVWNQSTKPLPEYTTVNNDKIESVMWMTEKPKRGHAETITANNTVAQTDEGQSLPTTVEMSNLTTQESGENSTTPLFTGQTPPLFEKLGTGTTVQSYSTSNVNTETVYPSSHPPSTLYDNTKTVTPTIPTSSSEKYNSVTTGDTVVSTIQTQSLPNGNNGVTSTTTTDSPFLIIVTDTNNHIVNTNENEPVETDYILISNSSALSHVNKPDEMVGDVNNSHKKNEVKIVDKICIDTELCNDEIEVPYFESTKTIRNNNPKVVSNNTNSEPSRNSTSAESVSKIINLLQNMKFDETGPSWQATDAESSIPTIQLNMSSNDDKLSLDSSHVYESLKMPPSSSSKVESPAKSGNKKKTETSTVQNLVHIVHPTPAAGHYSSTPVYNPSKKSPASPTTQRSPTLTTTKRIFTHSQPYTDDSNSNVYNLMYSIQPQQQPSNVDYPNSNEYLFGSSSSQMEPQYSSYDTSSYVRFPNEQQSQPYSSKQHPNSKFSVDFQNTFGSDESHQGGASGNGFIRFPTISRTPASTFNSRWSNTRWPPQAEPGQFDNSWNSRWPPHQQQQQQQQMNSNAKNNAGGAYPHYFPPGQPHVPTSQYQPPRSTDSKPAPIFLHQQQHHQQQQQQQQIEYQNSMLL